MAIHIPTFETAAPEFDPEVLENEFGKLVKAWEDTWDQPENGPQIVPWWQRPLLTRETVDAAVSTEAAYKKMADYAARAVDFASTLDRTNEVITYLRQIAFGGRFPELEAQFASDVLVRFADKTPKARSSEFTFGDRLAVARETANKHYKTGEFQEQLGAALAAIKLGIRKKILALDLEGVLISTSLVERKYTLVQKKLPPDANIRRPGANEILEALANPDLKNLVFVWTGVAREYAEFLIHNTGLELPSNVGLLAREDTAAAFSGDNYRQLSESRPRAFADPNHKLKATLKELKNGRLKVPRYFPGGTGIDVLTDDNAELHRQGCRTLLGKKEARSDTAKIMRVKPFSFTEEAQLSQHHLDTGLFKMIHDLRLRFSGNI